MEKLLLVGLFFILFSCGGTTVESITDIVSDSTATNVSDVNTPVATETTKIPLGEAANAIYKQFLFGKSIVSKYRKSELLLLKNGANYTINEDYQSTIQEEAGVIYTTKPALELVSDNFLYIKDVGYDDKNTLAANVYFMGFVAIKPTLVLCAMMDLWSEEMENIGLESGENFTLKAFENKNGTWVDVSSTVLTTEYKNHLQKQFKGNDISEDEHGVFSLSCLECLKFKVEESSLTVYKQSAKRLNRFVFKRGDNGELVSGVEE